MDTVHGDGAVFTDDVEDSLDAQHVLTVRSQQSFKKGDEPFPRDRIVGGDTKRADARVVAVDVVVVVVAAARAGASVAAVLVSACGRD